MSTNFEIISHIYAAGPEALFAALSRDVEWTETAGFPYGGTYRGTDEVVKNVFSRLGSEWEGFKAEADHIYDAGDTVIATGFYSGTFRATGRSMKASFAHVLTLRDGKVVRFVQYADSKLVWDAMAVDTAPARRSAEA